MSELSSVIDKEGTVSELKIVVVKFETVNMKIFGMYRVIKSICALFIL